MGRRRAEDEAAVTALALGRTAEQAAAESGLSVRTISRRRADPEFNKRIDGIRSRLLSEISGKLIGATVRAVETLEKRLDSDNENASVAAARCLTESLLRVLEFSALDRRLQQLEERLAGNVQ